MIPSATNARSHIAELWFQDQILNWWFHTVNYQPCCFSSKWVTKNSRQNPDACKRSTFVVKLIPKTSFMRCHCTNTVDDPPSSTASTHYRRPSTPLHLKWKNSHEQKTREWTNKTESGREWVRVYLLLREGIFKLDLDYHRKKTNSWGR